MITAVLPHDDDDRRPWEARAEKIEARAEAERRRKRDRDLIHRLSRLKRSGVNLGGWPKIK